MTDALIAQYDAYPYPARDPRDEAQRLIEGSPSHLDEINHFVFGGRLDFARPFRALVAGGGTGDGLIMLAQHCADAGVPAAITYLDLSTAARAIAEARAAVRGLSAMISFRTGSLLDAERLAPGPFDYIDCCGVLHHLEDPAGGLQALAARLAPGGGIGLMLYGAYGRTGVYPLQNALRRLTGGMPDAERIELARRLTGTLPSTNWFRRNLLLSDHRQSDAGLYDLLLHSRDRAFTVPEIFALVEECGLAVTGFVEPLRYDPAVYLTEPRLRTRLGGLDPAARMALAEELAGNIKSHVFYAVRRGEESAALARPDRPEVRPVPRDLDPEMIRSFRPGQPLAALFDGLEASVPMPPLTGAMLSRIDGKRSLAALHAELNAVQNGRLSWDAFKRQFDQLYGVLHGLNKLYLSG